MRLGIADHFGWAVAVTASADHAVVDRRRIELVEPGVSAAPIHYDSARLDVAATAALVAKVRASVVRATSAAFDEIMYRQVLSELAHARNWRVHLYDAKHVEGLARSMLAERADAILDGPRVTLGPPWAKDHRTPLAATIVGG